MNWLRRSIVDPRVHNTERANWQWIGQKRNDCVSLIFLSTGPGIESSSSSSSGHNCNAANSIDRLQLLDFGLQRKGGGLLVREVPPRFLQNWFNKYSICNQKEEQLFHSIIQVYCFRTFNRKLLGREQMQLQIGAESSSIRFNSSIDFRAAKLPPESDYWHYYVDCDGYNNKTTVNIVTF